VAAAVWAEAAAEVAVASDRALALARQSVATLQLCAQQMLTGGGLGGGRGGGGGGGSTSTVAVVFATLLFESVT
jgi:hypothetical protein